MIRTSWIELDLRRIEVVNITNMTYVAVIRAYEYCIAWTFSLEFYAFFLKTKDYVLKQMLEAQMELLILIILSISLNFLIKKLHLWSYFSILEYTYVSSWSYWKHFYKYRTS